MLQKYFVISILLMICSSVLAADTVDSSVPKPTTPAEQSVQKPDAETQSGLPSASQAKETAASSTKRSRVDQDNFQQSTSNAQDLFQGDHN